MNIKLLTCTSAAALAVGAAALGGGTGVALAQPGGQCGPQGCQAPPGPGGPGGPGGPQGPGGPGGPGVLLPGQGAAPPAALAWRGIEQGRIDRQPFNYRGSWVNPIFNNNTNNWGFWFLGLWIPL